jgi:hypothetical protein
MYSIAQTRLRMCWSQPPWRKLRRKNTPREALQNTPVDSRGLTMCARRSALGRPAERAEPHRSDTDRAILCSLET